MRKLSQFVMAAAVVALVASPALAQRQRGGGGGGGRQGGGFGGMTPAMLLTQESVQKELKLTPDQVTKAKDLAEKQRGALQGLQGLSQEERRTKMQEMNKENEKVVASILQPDQAKRLHQISLQQQGARAFANPDVAKALNITDDQKKQIQDIEREVATQRRELFQGGGGQDARAKMAELTKKSNEKVMGLLTADQKAKWKDMTGEPFTGEIRPFGGAARPRQPRP